MGFIRNKLDGIRRRGKVQQDLEMCVTPEHFTPQQYELLQTHYSQIMQRAERMFHKAQSAQDVERMMEAEQDDNVKTYGSITTIIMIIKILMILWQVWQAYKKSKEA